MSDETVFVGFPAMKFNRDYPIRQDNDTRLCWLLNNAVDYGYRDEWCVGVFLSAEDASIYKLKFP